MMETPSVTTENASWILAARPAEKPFLIGE